MFFVIQRTWFEGADPTDLPDRERLIFAGSLYEAASRVVESVSRRLGASGRDPVTQTWWARGANTLHRFEITIEKPRLARRLRVVEAEPARVEA